MSVILAVISVLAFSLLKTCVDSSCIDTLLSNTEYRYNYVTEDLLETDSNNDTDEFVTSGNVLCFTPEVTYETCDVTDSSYRVSWDAELTTIPQISSNLTSQQVSSNGEIFEVQVSATADYVLRGDYSSLDAYDFGVTYVLGDKQFEDSGRLLQESTSCENRYSDDFSSSATNNRIGSFWTYTDQPFSDINFPGEDGLGMQYPVSAWTLETVDDTCENGIIWTRNFTFNELIDDCNFEWSQDTNNIYLSGYFYLTLVSPNPIIYKNLNYDLLTTDPGEYLTKQLQSLEIKVAFPKGITLINNGNIILFGSFIISSDFNRESNYFEITILTYVPRYLQIIDIAGIDIDSNDATSTWDVIQDGDGCLVQDTYRCWQKFIANRTIDNCENENIQILNNSIELFGNLDCEDSSDNLDPTSSCSEFKGSIDIQQTNNVALEQIQFYYVESCDDEVYTITFDGQLTFWDSTFTSQITEPYDSNGATVYMQVEIFGIDDYDILGISIESALLCTIDVLDPSTIEATSCSDSSIRDNSLWYDLFNENFNNIRDNSIDETDNIEQFSFILPLIADNTFFVDLTVLLTLNNGNRRLINNRKLFQNNNFNRYTNVFAGASFNADDSTSNKNNNDDIGTTEYIIIGFSILVFLITIVAIIFYVKYRNMQNSTQKFEINQVEVTKIKSSSVPSKIKSGSVRRSTVDTNTPTFDTSTPTFTAGNGETGIITFEPN